MPPSARVAVRIWDASNRYGACRVFVQRTLFRGAVAPLVVLVVLLLAGLSAGPGSPGSRAIGPVSSALSRMSETSVARTSGPILSAGTPVGPIGGRLFTVRSELPSGTSNSVTGLAVDPATGLVYASNEFAATITVFNETTGAVVQVQPVGSDASGNYPAGVLLDAVGHRLFVSISTRFSTPGAGGWLLVLNESTLAVEANISFSVSPKPPFEPTFIAYDPPTDQVFVENATMGIVAAVSLASGAVTGYLICPLATCAEHPYGLVDVPQFHTLVVPTCAKALWLVNTSNDSTRALISGPSNGALMAWTAFDSADQIMWVENYSYYGSVGTFLGYNLSTLALVADAPGAPARESGMAYDPVDNLLVTTDIDEPEAIATYDATTGALVASSEAKNLTGHPFLALAVDPRTGRAIAGGPSNDTTIAFALPSLAVDQVYSSFPLTQTAAATDPTDGNLLITGLDPNTVTAQNESTGATAWVATLPETADPVGVVYDADTASVYVADASSASIFAYDATTGAYQTTYALGTVPSGVCALAADPAKALLYVGSTDPAEIVAFNLTLGMVVGTFVLTSYSPCRLAVDAMNHELFVLATPGTSDLFVLAPDPGGLITERATWSVPSSAVDLAVTDSGTAYVLTNSGNELVTLTQPNGAAGPSLNLSATPASAVALDPIDGLLFLSASAGSSVDVVGTSPSSLSIDGGLTAPNTVGPVAFDPASGVLVAATLDTGQLLVATLVAVPSSPTALSVTPGNDTIAATWGAPTSSGPDPVVGYTVAAHPSSAAGVLVSENVTGLSGSLAGLLDGVPYNLTVTAVSAAGVSTSFASLPATPAGVPYPPTNVTVDATTANSLTIDWAAPASDDGAAITGYVVSYAPASGGSSLTLNISNTTSIVVGGLAPQTRYSVSIVAENSVGTGRASTTVTASTGAPPSSIGLYVELAVVVVVVALVVVALWSRSRRRGVGPAPASPSAGSGEAADAPPAEGGGSRPAS
jgi:DNA-binding beta-propeller fold protein YncE